MRFYHLPLKVVPVLKSVAIAASILMLAACVQRPLLQGTHKPPCREITGYDLADLFVVSNEETDIATKLISQVNRTIKAVAQPEVVINGQPHESTVYEWQTGYANYHLTTFDKNAIIWRSCIQQQRTALGSHNCLFRLAFTLHSRYGLLGPDAGPRIRIEFFYEDKGIYYYIEIGVKRLSKTDTNLINEGFDNEVVNTSTPVKAIQWTLPSNVALMRWRFLYGKLQPTSEDEKNRLAMYKVDPAVLPWPGEIDKLEITYTYPEFLTPVSK